MPVGREQIRGIDVDAEGRCAHYHTELDVVANRCTLCGEFWACHECHAELAGHSFGRVGEGVPAVMCGVCGLIMDHATYVAAPCCPSCGHAFNPRCLLHAHKYFQPKG